MHVDPVRPAPSTRRERWRRRTTRAGMGLALALLATGCTGWGPIASSYQGKVRVRASGGARLDNHVWMINDIHLEDPIKDGNRVYASTGWWYHHEVCTFSSDGKTCKVQWDKVAHTTTPELTDATAAAFTHKRGLMPEADASRISVVACAQMGWPVPNSCSNEQAVITFNS